MVNRIAGVLGLALFWGCNDPEECAPKNFGSQCRGSNTATCQQRPERHGGGHVVHERSCGPLSCNGHYGKKAATCLPKQALAFCAPEAELPLGGGPADWIEAGGQRLIANAKGSTVEVISLEALGAQPQVVSFAAPVEELALGDFDGDSHVDLLSVSADSVALAFGLPNGIFRAPVAKTLALGVIRGVADVDADGRDDIVSGGDGKLSVFWSEKDGWPGASVAFSEAPLAAQIGHGDFDGDGVRELFVVGTRPWNITSVQIFGVKMRQIEKRQTGEFKWGTPTGAVAFDRDGDGKKELFVSGLFTPGVRSLTVPLATGSRASAVPVQFPDSSGVSLLSSSSQQLELVFPAAHSPSVAVLGRNSSQRFFADVADRRPLRHFRSKSFFASPRAVFRRGEEIVVFGPCLKSAAP